MKEHETGKNFVDYDDFMKTLNASLGWTPLHYMVEKENFDLVKQLIEENWDVNTYDNFNRTPLSIAAFRGNLELTQLLLENGAEVNRGFPLHYSCENGHLNTALCLIANGANINLEKDQTYPIIISSAKGHLELVKILVEHGADVHVVDEDTETALHWACETGNNELITFLIDAGCNIDAKDRFALTPLLVCLIRMEKRPALVKLLLEKGASIDIEGEEKNTLLHYAEHPESTLELIKRGVDINAQDNEKETPLYNFFYNKNDDCAKTLLEQGGDPNIQTSGGWTPLHLAAQRGNLDFVEVLLKKNANVNLASAQNIIPLHLAAGHGHLEIAQKLLEYGSFIDISMVDLPDINSFLPCYIDRGSISEGLTPLSWAASNGHVEICKLLISHGASFDAAFLPQELACVNSSNKKINDWPCSDVITAVRENNLAKIKSLSSEELVPVSDLIGWSLLHHSVSKRLYEMSQLVISKGVSANASDNYERTPLTVASANNDLEMIKLLVDNGVDVNSGLPLHYAVDKNSMDCIQELINCNCDINMKDKKEGKSPIMVAASAGKTEIVKLLLKNNADPNCVDKWGETPLHESCRSEDVESVATLIEHGANINAVTSCKLTPLGVAAISFNIDVVKLLLGHKADFEVKDDSGETALFHACSSNFTECVQELIKAGAAVDTCNDKQETPLFFAENLTIFRTLIEHGADVNHASFGGWTPLHESAYDGNIDCVKELLKYEASVNRASAEGVLPIYLASIHGHAEIVEELVKHGAYIDFPILDVSVMGTVCDSLWRKRRYHIIPGNTPLIGAASEGCLEVVKVLCSHGASLQSFNIQGNTALHEAVLNNCESVVEFLVALDDGNFHLKNRSQKTPLDLATEVANETIVNLIKEKVSVQ